MRGLVWFKKDLRVTDHPALYHACQTCVDGVMAVYLIDPAMWKKNNVSDRQIAFIFSGLAALKSTLDKQNISLLIVSVDSSDAIPVQLRHLMDVYKIQKIFFNNEWEFNESKRDQAVVTYLSTHQYAIETFEDQSILPLRPIQSKQGSNYKVFTAFKNAWWIEFDRTPVKVLPKPHSKQRINVSIEHVPTSAHHHEGWSAGEAAAFKRLNDFVRRDLTLYEKARDYPAENKTSCLSPYLATGMISAKTCFLTVLNQSANASAKKWLTELIWREFFRYVLLFHPAICKNKPYQSATDAIAWRYDDALFEAWRIGQTGFPIIDAAMRQLNQFGWINNRLRMLVASFLSKNLLLDWRLGEAYFAKQLIDIDFASNNGGWQWCASTGVDAVPYFRVFNPVLQSEKFDPHGEYIRQYCPELKNFNDKMIHHPDASNPQLAKKVGYPMPIVDLTTSRKEAINAFKKI